MDTKLNNKLRATNLPPNIQQCIRTIYASDKEFLRKFLPATRRNNNQQWQEFVNLLKNKK